MRYLECGVGEYAPPISGNIELLLTEGSVESKDEEDLVGLMKQAQDNDRFSGINFMNIGGYKNTIEFRIANGTIDADTWIQNINLFGGIIKAAENLSKIQAKPNEQRTEEEQKMLASFKKIKNEEISQEEKLELLLSIVIPEKERNIYRERYNVNSKLLEKYHYIQERLSRKIAKSKIELPERYAKGSISKNNVVYER